MRLIGMMDSPYVRRVAISLKLMRVAFEHQPLSVFRDYEAFAAVNPVVKAPTLVTNDGDILIDSTLIIQHIEGQVAEALRLTPDGRRDDARSHRLIGLALAACEKSVQLVYERELRPAEKQHAPWVERVRGQLSAAYGLLEAETESATDWFFGPRPMQADVSVAVAWQFTQSLLPGLVPAERYPTIAAFSLMAEALPEFLSSPPN